MSKFLAGLGLGILLAMALPSLAQDPCSSSVSTWVAPPPGTPAPPSGLFYCTGSTGFVQCY